MPRTVITQEHIKFALENYLQMTAVSIDKKFNVSKGCTLRILKNHGLKICKEKSFEIRSLNQKKPLSPEHKKYLIDHIHTKPIKIIAAEINRHYSIVSREAHELGFGEVIKQKSIDSRYKKGLVPFNKGKKRSPEWIEKYKHTFFQKGSSPHNSFKDFEEVIRVDKRKNSSYMMIKVPEYKRLIYKHRWIYEQKFGKIPKGFNIIFIDRNTLNCEIDNLKCISNEDLMLQNSIQNYPEDLKEIIRLKGSINRQINKIKTTPNGSRN